MISAKVIWTFGRGLQRKCCWTSGSITSCVHGNYNIPNHFTFFSRLFFSLFVLVWQKDIFFISCCCKTNWTFLCREKRIAQHSRPVHFYQTTRLSVIVSAWFHRHTYISIRFLLYTKRNKIKESLHTNWLPSHRNWKVNPPLFIYALIDEQVNNSRIDTNGHSVPFGHKTNDSRERERGAVHLKWQMKFTSNQPTNPFVAI